MPFGELACSDRPYLRLLKVQFHGAMGRSVAVLITGLLGLLVASPMANACGGGGSGGYRKPVRPEHFHQKAASQDTQAPATASPTQAPVGP